MKNECIVYERWSFICSRLSFYIRFSLGCLVPNDSHRCVEILSLGTHLKMPRSCHVDEDAGLAPSRTVMNEQLRFYSVVPVCANVVQYRMSLCHLCDGKVRAVNMPGDWTVQRLGEGSMIEYKISICARGDALAVLG